MTIGIAIIGLGGIGLGYDIQSNKKSPKSADSHSFAVLQNPDCRLVVGIDPDPFKRANFENATKAMSISSLADLNKYLLDQIDALIIATPTSEHIKILQEISLLNKSFWIMCEKPFCSNLREVNSITSLVDSSRIIINYSRRFSSDIDSCQMLFTNFIEKLPYPSITVKFFGGVLRTGSHFIDLANHWFWEEDFLELPEMVLETGKGYAVRYPKVTIEFLSLYPNLDESYADFYAKSEHERLRLVRNELVYESPSGLVKKQVSVSQNDSTKALVTLVKSNGELNPCGYQDAKRVHEQVSLMPRFDIK